MTTSIELYMLLLLITSTILFVLWLLSMEQLCITKLYNAPRIVRTVLLVLFSTLSVLLNVLVYLSSIYPNFSWQSESNSINLSMLSNGIESVVLIIGFHIAQIVISSMIFNMYSATGSDPPKWIKYALHSGECFIIITILICYSLSFIYTNLTTLCIFSFYIVMSLTIIVEDICILFIMKKVLTVLQNVPNNNESKVKLAIHSINIGMFFLWLIMVICVGFILISVTVLYNYMEISVNLALINDILHSLLIIAVLTFFEWWVYVKHKCGVIETHSICIVCGCGDFWMFYCDCCCQYDVSINGPFKNLKYEVLLRDSTTPNTMQTMEKRTIPVRSITPLQNSLSANTLDKIDPNTNSLNMNKSNDITDIISDIRITLSIPKQTVETDK